MRGTPARIPRPYWIVIAPATERAVTQVTGTKPLAQRVRASLRYLSEKKAPPTEAPSLRNFYRAGIVSAIEVVGISRFARLVVNEMLGWSTVTTV